MERVNDRFKIYEVIQPMFLLYRHFFKVVDGSAKFNVAMNGRKRILLEDAFIQVTS